MRTTLVVSLLAVSLGLTATCLLVIRVIVQQEIRKGLNADLDHSLLTFQNLTRQRNEMLTRQAALLADLPSLKSLMATDDLKTIQDGSHEFWNVSASDFFALADQTGTLFTYSNRGAPLNEDTVKQQVHTCLTGPDAPCMIAIGPRLYELAMQPLYFGPTTNDSRLGYVIIGYEVDNRVAREVSEAAAADVVFLVNGEMSATTVPSQGFPNLTLQNKNLSTVEEVHATVQLAHGRYIVTTIPLAAAGQTTVQLSVLKSYDRASAYLKRVNRWIAGLGLSALLIGIVLAVAISRTVTRPLETLVAGTRALGRGDFNYRLRVNGAKEVQELGLSFERMRSELKRTQSELIETERLATIGRMASSVSHDLRHHLSAIYASAEFMSLGKTEQRERAELLLEVKEAVQEMTDLIESLLLFSQTGQIIHPRYESLAILVERTIHAVRQHPESRAVQVTTGELQPIDAWVDGKKLSRAIYNLLLNACQAAKLGGGPAMVLISLTEDEDRIRISIFDSGPGVPISIQQTLFQPFVSSGKTNGIGLGLTLAQHIAQEHGGEVKLEESSTGMTVFSILLSKAVLQTFSDGKQTQRVVESIRVHGENR